MMVSLLQKLTPSSSPQPPMSYRHGRSLPLPLPLLFFFLLLFASSAGKFTVLARCLPDQSAALHRLKQGFLSFSASNASRLASWRLGTDCCLWAGITCDKASGRVTALDLGDSSISGNIDPALFNLTSLRSLNLSYNQFQSIPIPSPGFERLGNLTHLNLSNSGFIGQVPIGISRLTRLVSLDLSSAYIFANPNPNSSVSLENPDLKTLIQNLTDLTVLYLDGIKISPADGAEWCRALSVSAPNLRFLSLSSCSLSGPIDSSLSQLKFLSLLRLDQNNLSSEVPEFLGHFSSLRLLRLSSCGLYGSLPKSIFKLVNLTNLDVSSNPKLSGQLPEFLEGSVLEDLLLFGTGLSGYLPVSIGNLKVLKRLQISSCNFSGPIPDSIGNLTQMVHLDLSSNNFSGMVPSFMSSAKISEIVLSHNSLTGSIPSLSGEGGLQNLRKLDLRNNSLTGPISESLFSLPLLETVYLSNNKLQGLIPKSVSNLTELKILTLASNNLSGTVDLNLFQNLVNLSILDLSNNMLTVETGSFASFPKVGTLKLASCNMTKFPDFLRNQDRISNLDLSNNRIGGPIPNWIWNIGSGSLSYLNLSRNSLTEIERPLPDISTSSLSVLDLHSNKLRGPILLPPPSIIVVDYSSNNFTYSIPSNITSYLSFTIFFSLANNSLVGEIPSTICNASYLQVLDLSKNYLSGSIPQCLGKMSNVLCVLNLRGNRFHGYMDWNFSEGCNLRTINLNGNQLKGPVPKSLSNCKMLEVLDLGNNQIVDTFPFWLGNLSELQVLVLRSNGFFGPMRQPQGDSYTFPLLQIIDISSNKFNGTLSPDCIRNWKAMMNDDKFGRPPVEFGFLEFSGLYYQNTVTVTIKGLDTTLVKILTIFTSIDLSNNGFQGEIPEVMGELKSLYVLNMSGNHLTGRIPPLLGRLTQLESLDLSRNRLSGEIPEELTTLTFLSSLNLSYNLLVGRIPQARQFLTFANESYKGNKELCGTPLSKQCNSTDAAPPSEYRHRALFELDWEFIFVGLGYGGGLGLVVGSLMFWRKGRRWYFMHVDKMLWAVLPSTLWICSNCRDGKVNAEERIEEDGFEMESEDGNRRRFCLFCTQLEFSWERVIINHVECSCPIEE